MLSLVHFLAGGVCSVLRVLSMPDPKGVLPMPCGTWLVWDTLRLTVQSERKPSKTTDVMVGMLTFSMAEKAALLATAGLVPGPAAAGDVCRGKVGRPAPQQVNTCMPPCMPRNSTMCAFLALGSPHSRPLWHLHHHGRQTNCSPGQAWM